MQTGVARLRSCAAPLRSFFLELVAGQCCIGRTWSSLLVLGMCVADDSVNLRPAFAICKSLNVHKVLIAPGERGDKAEALVVCSARETSASLRYVDSAYYELITTTTRIRCVNFA